MTAYVTTCEIQGCGGAPDLPEGSPITPEVLEGLGYYPHVWHQMLARGDVVPASGAPEPMQAAGAPAPAPASGRWTSLLPAPASGRWTSVRSAPASMQTARAPAVAVRQDLGDRVADILTARRRKRDGAEIRAAHDATDARLASLLERWRRTGAVAPSGQPGDLGDLAVAVLLERRAAGALRA